MPDDPIVAEPAVDEPTPALTPTPAAPTNGGEAPPAATAGVSAEQVAEMIAPLQEQVTQATAVNQQIVATLQGMAPRAAEVPADPSGEDFLTRFSTDPRGAIESVVGDQVKTLAPFFNTVTNSAHSAFVGLEAQAVDEKFGSGAWDAHFAKPIESIWAAYRQSNPTALADRTVIQREINGLKGALLDELVDHREKSRTATTKAEDAEVEKLVEAASQRVGLTGGIRRTDTAGEPLVTEGLKGYLAERERAIGEKVDPKEWLAEHSYEGNSLSHYLAHQKKLAAKKDK